MRGKAQDGEKTGSHCQGEAVLARQPVSKLQKRGQAASDRGSNGTVLPLPALVKICPIAKGK